MLSGRYRFFWIMLALIYMGTILWMAGQSITVSATKSMDRFISNLLHIPAFAVLILILIPVVCSDRRRWLETIFIAGAIAFTFGVVVELYQITIPFRTASFEDILLDAIGILIGMFILRLSLIQRGLFVNKVTR